MKKLLTALAVVVITGMTQAASFKWTTQNLYAPNADGSAGSTVASAATGTWLATVTLYSDFDCTVPVTGVTGNVASIVNAMSNALGGTFAGADFAFDNNHCHPIQPKRARVTPHIASLSVETDNYPGAA